MTDDRTFIDVAAKLTERGIRATYEYPGYLDVAINGRVFAIGTANGTWEADLYLSEAHRVAGFSPDSVFNTGIPGDSADITAISDALAAHIIEMAVPERT